MIHTQNKNPTINWQWADIQRIVYEDNTLFFSGHSCLRVPQTKGELASIRILGTADYSVTQTLFQDLRGLGTCFSYWPHIKLLCFNIQSQLRHKIQVLS
jgi:hypothetical protein